MDIAKSKIGEFLEDKHSILSKPLTWIFTAIYALAGVSFWRGVWFLMKMDIGIGSTRLVIVLSVSLVILIYTGVSRSLIASPLGLSLDDRGTAFKRKVFFRKSSESVLWLFLDVTFTNMVVRQLIVFCWWSLWSLLNTLSPQYQSVAYDSLILGYIGFALCLMLDKLIQKLTTSKFYLIKPAVTVVTILAFLSSVAVWRGLWSLLDVLSLYSFPQY